MLSQHLPWGTELLHCFLCGSSELQLGAFPAQGFKARVTLPQGALGRLHWGQRNEQTAGRALPARLRSSHGSLHCSSAPGTPCRRCSYKQWREQQCKDLSIDRCRLLRSSFLLHQWGESPIWELWSTGMPGWRANPEHTMFTELWHSGFTMWAVSYSHPHSGHPRPHGHPTLLGLAQKQLLEQVVSGLNLALHKLRAHVWGCDRIEKDLAVTCKVTPTFKSWRSIWTRTGGSCPHRQPVPSWAHLFENPQLTHPLACSSLQLVVV